MKTGYNAVRWMRGRDQKKRGGLEKPDDGLNRNGLTMAVYMDQFLESLRVTNRTDTAVTCCRVTIGYFLRWAQERDLLYPNQITRSILESYQRYLYRYRKTNGSPLGISTQYTRLNGVKRYFSWLCRQHLLEANPASELEMPRRQKQLPVDTFSVREVEAILGVPDITDLLGIRDRAMLEVFYSTGMRRSELINMDLSDINRDKGTIFIRQGKGHKDRVVPVGDRAMSWLEKYLDDVRPLLATGEARQIIFLSGYGERFNPDVLSRVVRSYVRKADIGRAYGSCHQFRHACATHMLEGGADIRYIQHLLGHSNLDTTAVYTRVSIKQLKLIHSQTHPAESHKTAD